jgi:hypothetical protein
MIYGLRFENRERLNMEVVEIERQKPQAVPGGLAHSAWISPLISLIPAIRGHSIGQ